jgi:hypothetical protein
MKKKKKKENFFKNLSEINLMNNEKRTRKIAHYLSFISEREREREIFSVFLYSTSLECMIGHIEQKISY